MYLSRRAPRDPTAAGGLRRALRRGVPAPVLGLGVTSLCTDVASEAIASVLPLFLAFELHFTPLQFGAFDGGLLVVGALAMLAGGGVADHWRHPKRVAASGYGLSTVSRAGLYASATAWPVATGFLWLDRVGKGLRTPPHDAMISVAAEPAAMGTAFGVHRALDTTGALLGPLLAAFVLARLPGAYDAVFAMAVGFSVLGLAVLVLFVADPLRARATRVLAAARVGGTGPTADRPASPSAGPALRSAWRHPELRHLTAAVGLLGLLTVSDAFLYLSVQRVSDLTLRYFPLLFVGTALSYVALAIPFGHLADRAGPARVFLAGHVALGAAYLCVLGTRGRGALLVGMLVLLGAYYAATDGVVMVQGSRLVPAEARSSALALVRTVAAGARFVGARSPSAWRGPATGPAPRSRCSPSRSSRDRWCRGAALPVSRTGPDAVSTRRRLWAFLGVVVAVAVVVGAVVLRARGREERRATRAPEVPAATDAAARRAVLAAPYVLFESRANDADYTRALVAPLATPDAGRVHVGVSCERVDARAGQAVCLAADRGVLTTYRIVFLDADLHERGRHDLVGSPSRVRLSPDGSVAATTVFVTGHSYAQTGFSTQTRFWDVASMQPTAEMERDVTVTRDGSTLDAVDRNFWGVTFVDADRFYATLGTGGHSYLIEGSLAQRRAHVVRDGVECPSRSPDGTRIVFKRRVRDRARLVASGDARPRHGRGAPTPRRPVGRRPGVLARQRHDPLRPVPGGFAGRVRHVVGPGRRERSADPLRHRRLVDRGRPPLTPPPPPARHDWPGASPGSRPRTRRAPNGDRSRRTAPGADTPRQAREGPPWASEARRRTMKQLACGDVIPGCVPRRVRSTDDEIPDEPVGDARPRPAVA